MRDKTFIMIFNRYKNEKCRSLCLGFYIIPHKVDILTRIKCSIQPDHSLITTRANRMCALGGWESVCVNKCGNSHSLVQPYKVMWVLLGSLYSLCQNESAAVQFSSPAHYRYSQNTLKTLHIFDSKGWMRELKLRVCVYHKCIVVLHNSVQCSRHIMPSLKQV